MNISGPAAVAKPEMLFYAPGDLTVTKGQKFTHMGREKKNAVRYNMDEHRITALF